MARSSLLSAKWLTLPLGSPTPWPPPPPDGDLQDNATNTPEMINILPTAPLSRERSTHDVRAQHPCEHAAQGTTHSWLSPKRATLRRQPHRLKTDTRYQKQTLGDADPLRCSRRHTLNVRPGKH